MGAELSELIGRARVIDLTYPLLRPALRSSILACCLYGTVLGATRLSGELAVAWLVGAPHIFYAFLGLAALTHLGAGFVSGFVTSALLRSADLVITAEGQIDVQTAYGKSVGAVAGLAKRYGIPVLALAGGLGEHYQSVYALGVDAVTILPSRPMTLTEAMEHAFVLASDATERALRILRIGTMLKTH